MDKYNIILADPPWFYNARNNPNTKFCRGIYDHYQPLTAADILALDVAKIAADDALLFLWTTNPRLPLALEVMKAWGFAYVTTAFHWVKLNTKDGKPFFGIGYYTKSNPEICLLGRRGKAMKPAVDTISSLIVAPRGEHSSKPVAVHERIEAMYPNARKVELFARSQRDGWACLGDGVDGRDIREVLGG